MAEKDPKVALRDELRTKTLGQKRVFKKKIIDFDDAQIELRSLTVGQRIEITNRCTKTVGQKETVDPFEFAVWSLIYCCWVPGTEYRIFSEEDYERFKSEPVGGFVDRLWSELVVMNSASIAELEKN